MVKRAASDPTRSRQRGASGQAARFILLAGVAWLIPMLAAGAPLPFTGTLRIDTGGQLPISLSGAGVADVVLSAGQVTRVSIPAGAFSGTAALTPPSGFFPIVRFDLAVANPTLVLSAGQPACDVADPAVGCSGSGPLHGRAGLVGSVRAGLLGTAASPLTFLTLPASPVGGAGSFFATNTAIAAAVRLVGAGWTTGTAFAFGTRGGSVVSTALDRGGVSLGAGGGSIQIVTPLVIRGNHGVTSFPGFSRIDLTFVPQPKTGVLLGTGLGLLALRSARLRRREKDV